MTKAQSTIEYLIILSVIITSLLVITMIATNFFQLTSPIPTMQNKQEWNVYSLSLIDAIVDDEGNAFLIIKNNLLHKVLFAGLTINNETILVDNPMLLLPEETKTIFVPKLGKCENNCVYEKIIIHYQVPNSELIFDSGGIALIPGKNNIVSPEKLFFDGPKNSLICIETGKIQECNAGIGDIDLSNYVSYTGATQNVDLGDKYLGTKQISLTGAKRGNALQFNGENAYVSFERNAYTMGVRGQATFSFWVNPIAGDSSSAILGDWANILGSDAGFGFQYLIINNTLKFILRPNSANTITVTEGIQPNVWSHVVGVLDLSNSKMKLFVNGSKIGETTLYNEIGKSYRYVRLGTFSDWGINTYFEGSIDEVMIWNRALSDEEILNVYSDGVGETAIITKAPYNTGLINGYHLDEGTGNIAYNIGSSGNTGLISFAEWIPGYVLIEDTTKNFVLLDNQLKLDNGIWLNDNEATYFGSLRDGKIFYDGNNLHINPKNRGIGQVVIDGEIKAENVVGYIPYVGSNQNVDLDTFNLNASRIRSPYFDIRGERIGKAVVLNGSSSYVQMNNNAIPKGLDFTFNVWANPSALDSTYDGVFTTQTPAGGTAFGIIRNGGNSFFTINYPLVSGSLNFPAVKVGEWHLYSVVRYDNVIYAYFDGELVDSKDVSGTETQVDAKMRYGTYRVKNEHYYQGLLEESTIFNRPLSQAEIKLIYNNGKGLHTDLSVVPYNNGLVSAYRWTSGNTVYDLVSNNNGTVSNCSYTEGLVEANVGEFESIILEDHYLQPTTSFWYLDNNGHFFGNEKDASIYYDGINLLINPKENGSGIVSVNGEVKTAGYKSSDGSSGITNTTNYWLCKDASCNTTCQVQIKNGLIVGCV